MAKIWNVRVKDGNGKEIYGDDYADIWAINRLHFEAAAPKDCDHVREESTFLGVPLELEFDSHLLNMLLNV